VIKQDFSLESMVITAEFRSQESEVRSKIRSISGSWVKKVYLINLQTAVYGGALLRFRHFFVTNHIERCA